MRFLDFFVNLLSGLSGLLQRFDYPTHHHPNANNDDRQGRQLRRDIPFVKTPLGSYQGYVMKALGGREFYAFEGIPYAEPPERFQPSIPKIPVLNEVYLARSPGPECLQFVFPFIVKPTGTEIPPIIGSEDCLTCDIYTPSFTNESHFPVVFHIHAGAFTWGKGSDYGPAYLLERDVVLVNCQYRLGVMGFLSTGDRGYPGNLALKDLKIALDWLHVVIPYFGGNRSTILLHAVSSGGVLAHLLAISPFARTWGLSSLVTGSGNAFSPWGIATPEKSAEMVRKLAILTLCSTNSVSKTTIACFKRRDPRILLCAQWLLMASTGFTELFRPTIEPPSPTAILTRIPLETYSNYRHEIPDCAALFYVPENDGHHAKTAFKIFRTHKFVTPQLFLNLLPELLQYHWDRSAQERNTITNKIVQFYGGQEKVMGSWDVALKIFSDFHFAFPAWLAVHSHGGPTSPSYAMIYTHKSKNSGIAHRFGVYDDDIVVGHAEGEVFLYNRTDFKPLSRNTSDPEYQVLRGWQAMFLSLASDKTLQLPLSPYEDEWQTLTVVPYIGGPKGDFDVLYFGKNIAVTGSSTERRVVEFWWDLGIYTLQK